MNKIIMGTILLVTLCCCANKEPLGLPTDMVPATMVSMPLTREYWTNGTGVYTLKQVALLETGNMPLQMEGVLQLDLAAHTARLIALGGFGMKYFDIEVTPATLTVHSSLPVLDRFPDFLNQAASTIRRIYLIHQPQSYANIVLTETGLTLVTHGTNTLLAYSFNHDGQLIATKYSSSNAQWTIEYDYSSSVAPGLPTKTILTDTSQGYRLTLQLTSVKHHE